MSLQTRNIVNLARSIRLGSSSEEFDENSDDLIADTSVETGN